MKALAVIPARSGSKGVIDKNIKLLGSHPLIAFSISAGLKSSLIDRVIVSTDSEKYAKIARGYGAEIPFLRPSSLSGDFSTDYEFINHSIEWLQKYENYSPDLILNLRPVTPLRDPDVIDIAIETLLNNKESTSLRSVHEMPETAYKSCEISSGYLQSICEKSFDHDALNGPRQSFPKTFSPNGYVDVMRTSFIIENKILYGNRVLAFKTPFAKEIDTMDDFIFLEWQVKESNNFHNKLFKVN